MASSVVASPREPARAASSAAMCGSWVAGSASSTASRQRAVSSVPVRREMAMRWSWRMPAPLQCAAAVSCEQPRVLHCSQPAPSKPASRLRFAGISENNTHRFAGRGIRQQHRQPAARRVQRACKQGRDNFGVVLWTGCWLRRDVRQLGGGIRQQHRQPCSAALHCGCNKKELPSKTHRKENENPAICNSWCCRICEQHCCSTPGR